MQEPDWEEIDRRAHAIAERIVFDRCAQEGVPVTKAVLHLVDIETKRLFDKYKQSYEQRQFEMNDITVYPDPPFEEDI